MLASDLEPLLTPMKLNRLELSNRMVLGPMAVTSPTSDGRVTDQTIAFFQARARGGVAMIIVGGSTGTKRGWDESPIRPIMRMDQEESLPGLRRLGEAVHACGVPIIAEVMTGFGRMGTPAKDRPIISASPLNVVIPENRFPQGIYVPGGRTTSIPQEATIAEIEALESETVESCLRMQRAGWDGVELPAHMSYFTASFLSPRTNWRTDQYGGSAANRGRMLSNMVREVRKRAGPDFVIGLRITSNDYVDGGQGADGYAAVAAEVERAGLDYVALMPGCYERMDLATGSYDGLLVDKGDADAFRKVISVPLLLQGLHDPSNASRAIREGHGDLVMLARPLLADPDYARKIATGRAHEIIRCNRDNLCVRRMIMNMPPRCAVNPRTGRESEAPGSSGGAKRLIAGPIEALILKLTGSKGFMSFVGKLMRAGSKRPA